MTSDAPSAPRTTAVVVTYRSRKTIAGTLDACQPSYDAGRLRVVLVDNASEDGTAAFVRDSYPWVDLVEAGGNLGFGRGCNLGFERVGTPYVLFLNPDASLDLGALTDLENHLDAHPEVGIVGPAIRYEDGGLQRAGMLITPASVVRSTLRQDPFRDAPVIEPGAAPFETSTICGAIMMMRSELFRRLGGFDERFFLYFEETDLCLRVIDSGSKVWATGTSTGYHIGGASARESDADLVSGCIAEHYYPSRYYFLRKHYGRAAAVIADAIDIGGLAARAVVRALRRQERDDRLSRRLRASILRPPPPPPGRRPRSTARNLA